MKKFLSIMVICILCAGCQSESENEIKGEQMARFCISYSLDESVGESMTRSPASDGWAKFYAKIKSGELVADSYDITFTNSETNQSYTFNGKWANKEMLVLPTGKYTVSGTSNDEGDRIQQKCSITFNTTVEIGENTSEIILNAGYNCFLLAFENSEITEIQNWNWIDNRNVSENLPVFENYIYCFCKDKLYVWDGNTSRQKTIYLKGTFKSGSSFIIKTFEVEFQKGKYYIYTTVPSSFNIPEMESGM